MKPFIIWTVITLIVFGVCSGGYHFYLGENPRKILVAVDSSFPMKAAWARVTQILETLDDQRYAAFSLVTEKNKIHSWRPELNLGTIVPYAPPDFSKLTGGEKYSEIDEALQKYLITTDTEASQSKDFKGWTIIQLTP